MTFSIRPERPGEQDAIGNLIAAAFEFAEHSSGTEAEIVAALRASEALYVSLVSEIDEVIVGHAAFSPVMIDGSDCGWFGLGPVAVARDHQGQGIGEALIRQGLAILQGDGAEGCVVLGDPAYYARFGFAADARLTLDGVPPEYFQVMCFGDRIPSGAVTYHASFDGA